MSIKVAFIGAGSVVFSKNLTGDILGYPEFKDATLCYMDIDEERLKVGADLCRKVAKALGANPTIEATTDRRKAVAGADFVINMVQIGGFNSTLVDFEIPRKYGLNFTIADTTGPGGLFRALRTFPMLSGLAQDMSELCPNATLLNYSNPMSMNIQTVTRTSDVKVVGLCHSVQGTLDEITRYIGEKSEDVAFICAGINHMAFYLKLEKDGVDLYPRLFEAMNDPKKFGSNKVRFELMKRLGYFITESSEHNAEYSSYFIPRGEEIIKQFNVPIDEYLRRCDGIVDEFERLKETSKDDKPIEVHRSQEYGSTIIHSITTGTPSVVYGNMPNNGAVSNLPKNCIVEVPTLVDRAGLQPTTIGEIPPQLVGYMQPHITQQELFIRAALEGRRDHVYQAAMFDPLTAATLTLDQIVEMCDELIEAQRADLPNLDAKKTLVPTSGKQFSPPTAQQLRDSWDNAQKAKTADAIEEWKIIGPFKAASSNDILGFATALESEIGLDRVLDLQKTYADSADKDNANVLTWQDATVHKGFVDLIGAFGQIDNAVAYAYAEIESIHPRDALLKCGSDDGIKVWINGQLVHEHETQRGHTSGSDQAPIHLNAGVNKIVVKVSQYVGGWAFSVAIPKANF